MPYPGGKNGSGTYQKLINLMPPHDIYVEPFLGSGAIMRLKKPARRNIGLDLSLIAVRDFHLQEGAAEINVELHHQDSLVWLMRQPDLIYNPQALIYLDPPYLLSTRRDQRPLYEFEMLDELQHKLLLEMIVTWSCKVMISGYYSELYASQLATWRTFTFKAVTRSGAMADEWVWMNYPEPFALHDYSYLGENYRKREQIKRQQARWRQRLLKMPTLQRQALLSVIDELK